MKGLLLLRMHAEVEASDLAQQIAASVSKRLSQCCRCDVQAVERYWKSPDHFVISIQIKPLSCKVIDKIPRLFVTDHTVNLLIQNFRVT